MMTLEPSIGQLANRGLLTSTVVMLFLEQYTVIEGQGEGGLMIW